MFKKIAFIIFLVSALTLAWRYAANEPVLENDVGMFDEEAGKNVKLYTYTGTGADHSLSGSAFIPAMARSVEFFDKHLK